MSLAGVRSSQGDGLQVLVALRYAVEMIYTPTLLEIEVDSTALDNSGQPLLVDDVVVYYEAAALLVQVKKNQSEHRAWSIADLSDELTKAWGQWQRDPGVRLLFVSRNDFGDLARLRDLACAMPSPEAFFNALIPNLRFAAERVVACSRAPASISELYRLLVQLDMETINPERFRTDLLGQLRLHVSHADSALETIRSRIEAIARRETQQRGRTIEPHRLTRADLTLMFREHGVEVCQPKAAKEAALGLSALSLVGRSWPRTIGPMQLDRPVLAELEAHLSRRSRCLLLAAAPGAGKTCLMLSLFERLEAAGACTPVYVQMREFSGARTVEEREALGMPRTLVEDVARLSESQDVVVLIDSLDVLSNARDHHALGFALSLVDRLRNIPRVCVVAACRSFDLKYHALLAAREWDEVLEVDLLAWEEEVVPVLQHLAVEPHTLPAPTQALLRNPRLLALFHDIVVAGTVPLAHSGQELTEVYLQRVVRESACLGDAGLGALRDIAQWMLDHRRLDLPRGQLSIPADLLHALLSAGVLVETHTKALAFSHQTLLDVLAVSAAKARRATLAATIRNRAATPFVRPTVRAFLFSLRSDDAGAFRRQVREVVEAEDIAFHLRRLVAESLSELVPSDDDWPMVRHLFASQPALFAHFYQQATSAAWTRFLHVHWLGHILQAEDSGWSTRFLERLTAIEGFFADALDLWLRALDWTWVDQERLRWISSRFLERHVDWSDPSLRRLFDRFVLNPADDHGALGKPLARWVTATQANDDLLWRYITRRVPSPAPSAFDLGDLLECDGHTFTNERFLISRMCASETLLELALTDLERWSAEGRHEYERDSPVVEGFLDEVTSYLQEHTRGDLHRVSGLTGVLDALEAAIGDHGARHSPWWEANAERLRTSPDAALRYFAIRVVASHPGRLRDHGAAMLLDGTTLLFHGLQWQVAQLVEAAFPFLTLEEQETVQGMILREHDEPQDTDGGPPLWQILSQRNLLAHVPAPFRTPDAQQVIDRAEQLTGTYSRRPAINSSGGYVGAPVSRKEIGALSDHGLLLLARHYRYGSEGADSWERHYRSNLIGGPNEVIREFREAASQAPARFQRFYDAQAWTLEVKYRHAVLDGIAVHLRYRFGRLRSDQSWVATESPEGLPLAEWLLRQMEREYDGLVACSGLGELLQAVCELVDSDEHAERVSFLLAGALQAPDPGPSREDSTDVIFVAINSERGRSAQAAFTLADRRVEAAQALPALLVEALKRCAADPHASVRALVLRSLPFLISRSPELGWSLFDRAIDAVPVAWEQAYNCLYYHYYREFPRIGRYLTLLRTRSDESAASLWSRISALCVLAGHISLEDFLAELRAVDVGEAWSGATAIFVANLHEPKLKEQCTRGLVEALVESGHESATLGELSRLFLDAEGRVVPMELVEAYAGKRPARAQGHAREAHHLGEWLATVVLTDPAYTLRVVEVFLERGLQFDTWDGAPYACMLTALFREAEERELADDGQFLARVVAVQDALLKLDIASLDGWLKAAERE